MRCWVKRGRGSCHRRPGGRAAAPPQGGGGGEGGLPGCRLPADSQSGCLHSEYYLVLLSQLDSLERSDSMARSGAAVSAAGLLLHLYLQQF